MGLASAEALASEGCRVMIAGRNQQRLQQALGASSHSELLSVKCADVGDRQSVRQLIDEADRVLGQVDIFVNSAGINVPNRSIDLLAPEDWDRLLRVNATGSYNCMYAVLPQMRARGDGLIVNISSIAGKRGDLLGGVAYCAAKFAQAGLGRTVAGEVGTEGVRVTTIYPGEANTPLLDARPTPVTEEHRARILQPEDIGAAVLMIACLPPRAHIPELIITPTCQPFV